jgi:hypothetical protein
LTNIFDAVRNALNSSETESHSRTESETLDGPTFSHTLTEALQRVTGRDSCPMLTKCDWNIAKGYLVHFCMSRNYVRCHYLAKRMGELKSPVDCISRLAMEQERDREKEGITL